MIFEIVENKHRKFPDIDISIPEKGSKFSAGYDFKSNETYTLKPNEKHIFWTDIKVKISRVSFLMLIVRSSIGIKKNLRLANTIGIIDADYYENPDNDGNIGICLHNYGDTAIEIKKGDRIVQGIVIPYISFEPLGEIKPRDGGIGSTGE